MTDHASQGGNPPVTENPVTADLYRRIESAAVGFFHSIEPDQPVSQRRLFLFRYLKTGGITAPAPMFRVNASRTERNRRRRQRTKANKDARKAQAMRELGKAMAEEFPPESVPAAATLATAAGPEVTEIKTDDPPPPAPTAPELTPEPTASKPVTCKLASESIGPTPADNTMPILTDQLVDLDLVEYTSDMDIYAESDDELPRQHEGSSAALTMATDVPIVVAPAPLSPKRLDLFDTYMGGDEDRFGGWSADEASGGSDAEGGPKPSSGDFCAVPSPNLAADKSPRPVPESWVANYQISFTQFARYFFSQHVLYLHPILDQAELQLYLDIVGGFLGHLRASGTVPECAIDLDDALQVVARARVELPLIHHLSQAMPDPLHRAQEQRFNRLMNPPSTAAATAEAVVDDNPNDWAAQDTQKLTAEQVAEWTAHLGPEVTQTKEDYLDILVTAVDPIHHQFVAHLWKGYVPEWSEALAPPGTQFGEDTGDDLDDRTRATLHHHRSRGLDSNPSVVIQVTPNLLPYLRPGLVLNGRFAQRSDGGWYVASAPAIMPSYYLEMPEGEPLEDDAH
ncbi:hypothetical protein IWQ60_003453 [Tieghemiomyces parasiticus]|uniref:Uncharacterized protein n=1 Tax=Tieghemiomyces parasiticus TaxID=78921 RepID=A0A9W8A9J5_9FUNG|nr:hypothetical protein IWQ60_003453 [Tieghemiomyces parasiticus]